MVSGLRSSVCRLAESGVQFIVVGDIAAVIHGAPLAGFDLCVLARRTAPKLESGMIQVLHSADCERSYEDILPNSTLVELEPGLVLRVANLDTVITLKEEQGRPIGLAVLPILRATLAEVRRLQSGASTTSE